jgi:hypothetical protein
MSDDAFIEATRNAPAETEPGQTVNDLYAQWKNAPEDARVSILRKMDPLLTQYAERVVWMQLHLTDSFLVREMVDALERDLHSFEGRSKFFVWVHSRLKLRCIDEWRFARPHFMQATNKIGPSTLRMLWCLQNARESMLANVVSIIG